jgi:ribosomal protein L35
MWKIKTNKSVAKRFKVTKSWKLKHSKTCRSHLLTKKGKATKKHKFGKLAAKVDTPRMASLIPYKLR